MTEENLIVFAKNNCLSALREIVEKGQVNVNLKDPVVLLFDSY